MRISDWSSDVCSSDLGVRGVEELELGATTDGRIVNNEVRIIDEATGALLGEGAEGEILVRGPEVMLGYTDQALTDDAFDQDGFFRTGDLGRIEFGDFLAVSGRKKDVIVRWGENISPQEIEDAMHRYPAITAVAVVAMPHERQGEGDGAYVIVDEPDSVAA